MLIKPLTRSTCASRSNPTDAPLIALDGDGVLLDYHEGYRTAWKKAFGETLTDYFPNAYSALERFQVPRLERDALACLRKVGFDHETWASMPALPGAVEACETLILKGYRLQVVSALPAEFGPARLENLRALAFPLEYVVATGTAGANPKVTALTELQPAIFVDDFLGYLQGLPASIHRVLIDARLDNSPNRDRSMMPPDSRFHTLLEFAVACPLARDVSARPE